MKNADKCAFPIKADTIKDEYIVSSGLSKREWYAGLAMQGILTEIKQDIGIPNVNKESMEDALKRKQDLIDNIGRLSVRYADSLLKELEETGGEQ